MMSNVAEGFDVWLAQWHGDVLRLCLALSLNRRAARELTFQAFLRLGACDAADDAQARRTVMTARGGRLRGVLFSQNAQASRRQGAVGGAGYAGG